MDRLTARNENGNAYYPECYKAPCYGYGCEDGGCDLEIRACNKLADYEDLGTPKQLKECLEKQTAKKPIKSKKQEIRYTSAYTCPSCNQGFTGTGIADYCYHCGQKLYWDVDPLGYTE